MYCGYRRVHQNLVATMMFYLKNEAAFLRGWRTAGNILHDIHDNVQDYVDVIRFVILRLGCKRTKATSGVRVDRLQSERANTAMGYRQDGLKETMPERETSTARGGVFPPES